MTQFEIESIVNDLRDMPVSGTIYNNGITINYTSLKTLGYSWAISNEEKTSAYKDIKIYSVEDAVNIGEKFSGETVGHMEGIFNKYPYDKSKQLYLHFSIVPIE